MGIHNDERQYGTEEEQEEWRQELKREYRKEEDYMPTFDTEEEYEQYFKREIELCDKYRDANGTLTFDSQEEFTNLLDSLFEGTGITYHYEGV